MSRRLVRGIEVNADTIAASLIKQIGPRGDGYLTADHTLERLHGDEFYVPRLTVRGPRASWEAAGAKDTYGLAKDWTRKFAAEPAAPLDQARKARLDEIVRQFSG